ncbi:MAG TPA: DUF4350 domain-containing protein [Gemmatimonadales bacterium]|nr:DUF4350 domain-containing protein [Gemmatimonadales bacterium]
MSYRLEIALATLLAAAIAVALWAANRAPKEPALDGRASTFLSGPQGSRALHEVLIRLGRPSERRRTALFSLADERARRPAMLVVLNPPIPLLDAELEQVSEFVRSGGAVLAAGRAGGITRCAGWRIEPDGYRDDSSSVRLPPTTGALRLPRAARVLAPWKRESTQRLEGLVKGGPEGDEPCSALIPTAIDTILAATNGRPVILRLHYRGGGGTITLAADPGWFTNAVWRDTDVPLVVLPLLTPRALPGRPPPGRVAWDEYHQGFGQEAASLAGRTWGWLREAPAGWAVLQLIAVALVWLALTAVRFGPARVVIERRRRSPLEHLEALAAGLEGAADADTAVQRLVMGLQRRLGRTGRDLESLELVMRGPRGRAAVLRLRHLITERDGSGRVLAAAQAVEDVWEELRPRTTRDAF